MIQIAVIILETDFKLNWKFRMGVSVTIHLVIRNFLTYDWKRLTSCKGWVLNLLDSEIPASGLTKKTPSSLMHIFLIYLLGSSRHTRCGNINLNQPRFAYARNRNFVAHCDLYCGRNVFFFFFLTMLHWLLNVSEPDRARKEGKKKWISSTPAIFAAQYSFSQSHTSRSDLYQIREFLLVFESIRKLTFLLWFFSFWEEKLKNNTCEILRLGYNKF